jgi:serine/threonine protein kinase
MRPVHREDHAPAGSVSAPEVTLEAGLTLPGPHGHLCMGRRLGASAHAQVFVVRSPRLGTAPAVVEFFADGPSVPRGSDTLTPGRSVLDLRGWPGWPAVAVVSKLPLTLPAPYDRLTLQRPIGWGGQGEIWLGSSCDFPRLALAVKLFSQLWYSPDILSRQNCLEEARHGVLVNSAHIVRTYQAIGLENHPAWPPVLTVMQYYPYSLACILRDLKETERLLPAALVLGWTRQLLTGLRDLHQGHHLVHRDLKPGNILLRLPGETDYTGPDSLADSAVLLADLGAACPIGERPVFQLQQDGWKAKELYVAGSQRGSGGIPRPLDEPDRERVAAPAEDLYALGLILSELLVVTEDSPTWLHQAAFALLAEPARRPAASVMLEWISELARKESLDTLYGADNVRERILSELAEAQAEVMLTDEPPAESPVEPTPEPEPPPTQYYRPTFGPLR